MSQTYVIFVFLQRQQPRFMGRRFFLRICSLVVDRLRLFSTSVFVNFEGVAVFEFHNIVDNTTCISLRKRLNVLNVHYQKFEFYPYKLQSSMCTMHRNFCSYHRKDFFVAMLNLLFSSVYSYSVVIVFSTYLFSCARKYTHIFETLFDECKRFYTKCAH